MDEDNLAEVEGALRGIASNLNRLETAAGMKKAHASFPLVDVEFETDEATYKLRREERREKNSGRTTWYDFEWFVEKTTKVVTKEL